MFTSPVVSGRLVALADKPARDAVPGRGRHELRAGGTAYSLTFTPGVVVYAAGCGGSDAITVNGKQQPRLWEKGALIAAARQLLHLTT